MNEYVGIPIRNTRSPRQNASTTPEEKNNAAERGKGRDSSSSSRYSARSQTKQYFAGRGIGDLYVARPIIGAAFEALILQSYVYFMSAHTYFTCDHFCKIATDLRLQGFLLRMPQDVDYPRINETPLGHTRRAGLRVLYFYRPDSGADRGDPNR